MIQKIGNKLQVQMEKGDGEKRKINFGNVIDAPTEEKILALGDVMVNVTKDDQLDSIVLTEQTRFIK